jgi:rhomboid protease GluP
MSRRTLAEFVAETLVAQRGFRRGTASAFGDACDIVLTRTQGNAFEMVCIVDREADPARRFGLASKAEIRAAMRTVPELGSVLVSLLLQVIEVGPGAGVAEDRQRLGAIAQKWSGFSRLFVNGWCVDANTCTVWTSALFGGGLSYRGLLEGIARAPRGADGDLPPAQVLPPVALPERSGPPWVTIGILAVLVLAFAAELAYGVKPWKELLEPDILTLIASGGLARKLVDANHEYYRFLTAAFLHGGLVHLLLNGVALTLAGWVLEPLLGRVWMFALFILGALGGSALSYLLNPESVVSVGASGAIMGLLAAAFVSSFRLPEGGERLASQMMLLRVLIPSLIPIWDHGEGGGAIDYAGHLGGAVVGAGMGVFLLRTWPREVPHPRFRGVAAVIAGIGVAATVVSVGFVVRARGDYQAYVATEELEREVVPDADMPKIEVEADLTKLAALSARYPRDPRTRYAQAMVLARLDKRDEAIAELRVGLAQKQILQAFFSDGGLEIGMRGELARLLVQAGQEAEAKAAVLPVCKAGQGGKVPEELIILGLCP